MSSRPRKLEQVTIVVDPGVGGGVVIASGLTVIRVEPMPDGEKAIAALLRSALPSYGRARLIIEHVSGYIGEAHPGAKMFVFGHNFGIVKGFALGVGITIEEVGPFSWQQRLGIGLRSERKDKAQWKRDLRTEARKRFPEWAPDLATADALLLWDYAKIHCPWRAGLPREFRND